MKSVITYIEDKYGIRGSGRICRVEFSKTGRTLYCGTMAFRSLKGVGYKSNYVEVDSGAEYWISRPRKDGNDTLYPGIVETDDDVREEYWRTIRKLPGKSATGSVPLYR